MLPCSVLSSAGLPPPPPAGLPPLPGPPMSRSTAYSTRKAAEDAAAGGWKRNKDTRRCLYLYIYYYLTVLFDIICVFCYDKNKSCNLHFVWSFIIDCMIWNTSSRHYDRNGDMMNDSKSLYIFIWWAADALRGQRSHRSSKRNTWCRSDHEAQASSLPSAGASLDIIHSKTDTVAFWCPN